jgi:hypothetical protein
MSFLYVHHADFTVSFKAHQQQLHPPYRQTWLQNSESDPLPVASTAGAATTFPSSFYSTKDTPERQGPNF